MAFDHQQSHLARRKERHRWIWALTCYLALVGSCAFPWLAFSVHRRNEHAFYLFTFLSLASVALAIVAYTASRYHSVVD